MRVLLLLGFLIASSCSTIESQSFKINDKANFYQLTYDVWLKQGYSTFADVGDCNSDVWNSTFESVVEDVKLKKSLKHPEVIKIEERENSIFYISNRSTETWKNWYRGTLYAKTKSECREKAKIVKILVDKHHKESLKAK